MFKDVEKRFDERFKSLGEQRLYTKSRDVGIWKSAEDFEVKAFLKQEIQKAFNEVVPEEKIDENYNGLIQNGWSMAISALQEKIDNYFK